jgi:hypothetical protein
MNKQLLPYGDIRRSDIVAKNGAHSGGSKRVRSRVVAGKTVTAIKRLSA